MEMELILAIDGGGSRTRCLAVDRTGKVVGESVTGPSNHLLIEHSVVKESLAQAIDQALRDAGVNRTQVRCLSAGLAGVDFDGKGAAEMEQLLQELGFENVLINGDMVIAHAGALGVEPGVIALAGTGSAILGVGKYGDRVKIGGWGPIYGDEGSAYIIGQRALRAAASAYDGRGPATALTDQLVKALGLTEFRQSVARVYLIGMEPREIAALSRIAYETAEAGDEVACSIFLRAGEELAEAVEAALRRLEMTEQYVAISYQGSVIESCRLVLSRFVESLKRSVPRAKVVPPEFEPVIGSYLLGCSAMGWEVNAAMREELRKRSHQRQGVMAGREGG